MDSDTTKIFKKFILQFDDASHFESIKLPVDFTLLSAELTPGVMPVLYMYGYYSERNIPFIKFNIRLIPLEAWIDPVILENVTYFKTVSHPLGYFSYHMYWGCDLNDIQQ